MKARLMLLTLMSTGVSMTSCASKQKVPDLALIYDEAAQNIGDERNPVIVIPGILGSKLEEPASQTPVWGAFTYGATDPDTPAGARLIALPMQEGVPLSDLRDEVVATEVLDTMTIDIGLIRGLEISAYIDILEMLAAGKYRDRSLGESGAIDYGGLHYTCFQFPYDWRRDISEQAVALHELVLDAIFTKQNVTAGQENPRVDIVAHSMGGLVLRYYLRYGPVPLPDDGSLPELTWAGAQYVENAILIGTPSAGSVLSLRQLIQGVNYVALITPTYQPAVLGTMPALYELLPRPRHKRVVDAHTKLPIDILDPSVWERLGWGLLDPEQDWVLARLLPDVESPETRRAIARDHLAKSLARTAQFFEAIDIPAAPPPGTNILLFAGDADDTPAVLAVNPDTGMVKIVGETPGDGTVTRDSALMDERVGSPYMPRLRSPVAWDSVQFLAADHMGLTSDPSFTDTILFRLLEMPRRVDTK